MCYNTRLTRRAKDLEAFYKVERLFGKTDFEEELTYFHANGFSHPLMWIIPQQEPNRITPSLWGIMPGTRSGSDRKAYYKEAVRFGAGLNARSEKLFDHFIYRHSALTKRCIIPVDGFFEPHTVNKKLKVPFYFERNDKNIMSLAGIYSITKDGYNSFAVLTKPATPLFAKVHNSKLRRPVILDDTRIRDWLNDSLTRSDIEHLIRNDMPDARLRTFPVSRDLYRTKVDSDRMDIIAPVEYPEIDDELICASKRK